MGKFEDLVGLHKLTKYRYLWRMRNGCVNNRSWYNESCSYGESRRYMVAWKGKSRCVGHRAMTSGLSLVIYWLHHHKCHAILTFPTSILYTILSAMPTYLFAICKYHSQQAISYPLKNQSVALTFPFNFQVNGSENVWD